jgi:hypothetical protein
MTFFQSRATNGPASAENLNVGVVPLLNQRDAQSGLVVRTFDVMNFDRYVVPI